MPMQPIYLSDALAEQVEVEAATLGTTPGRLLSQLALAGLCGAEHDKPLISAQVIKALQGGATTVAEIADATGIEVEVVGAALHRLAQVKDAESKRPIVALADQGGRAVWKLAA